jgi:hypothetical protein
MSHLCWKPGLWCQQRSVTRDKHGNNTWQGVFCAVRFTRTHKGTTEWEGSVESQNWDNNVWPRLLQDSNPRKIALAKTSSSRKLQTWPLVREGSPHQQTHNWLKIVLKNGDKLVAGPTWVPDIKTDWPTDRRWENNFDFGDRRISDRAVLNCTECGN